MNSCIIINIILLIGLRQGVLHIVTVLERDSNTKSGWRGGGRGRIVQIAGTKKGYFSICHYRDSPLLLPLYSSHIILISELFD